MKQAGAIEPTTPRVSGHRETKRMGWCISNNHQKEEKDVKK
jgi:hypothetical protein